MRDSINRHQRNVHVSIAIWEKNKMLVEGRDLPGEGETKETRPGNKSTGPFHPREASRQATQKESNSCLMFWTCCPVVITTFFFLVCFVLAVLTRHPFHSFPFLSTLFLCHRHPSKNNNNNNTLHTPPSPTHIHSTAALWGLFCIALRLHYPRKKYP